MITFPLSKNYNWKTAGNWTRNIMQHERYKKSKGEEIIEDILKKGFGLKLVKIPQSKNESPDFFVIKDDQRVAVMEVKDIDDPLHHYLLSEATREEEMKNAERIEKSYRSRILEKDGKGSKQLLRYKFSKLPLILVFVSFDMTDFYDLKSYLNECVQLKYSLEVDLYIWLNVHEPIWGSKNFEINKGAVKSLTLQGDSFMKDFLSSIKLLHLPLKISL